MPPYRGRFAPSPTGPLHAGSLVAALASWLDAKAQGGDWLVRIEDVDIPRCVAGTDRYILSQLSTCGMHANEPPVWQSQRSALYAAALVQLTQAGHTYPCACTRGDIAKAMLSAGQPKARHAELVYPGICRDGLRLKPARAIRLRTCSSTQPDIVVAWHDRRLGAQTQNVTQTVGDFVLKRADGLWAYQLAVVVDDAEQGITHVVRGEDLADNTPRQIYLQRLLNVPTPSHLHAPLVLGHNGEKLSKQYGAKAVDLSSPSATLSALSQAAHALGLRMTPTHQMVIGDWLNQAVQVWQATCKTLG